MRSLRGLAVIVAASIAMLARADPAVLGSKEIRGTTVDAETGQPVEGTVVTAVWDWLDFEPSLHGSGYHDRGTKLHLAESVTDAGGQFTIPAWGPVVKLVGKLADVAPRLLVFKSGYTPLEYRGAPSQPLRLSKVPPSAGFAAAIQAFQDGGSSPPRGLRWYRVDETPLMTLALHREKIRLGSLGAAIRGVDEMKPGRLTLTGLDPGDGAGAVLWIEWTLKRADGSPGTRRVVHTQQERAVSPWRMAVPRFDGWEPALDLQPVVRVYTTGYRTSQDVRWSDQGETIALTKLGSSAEVQASLRAARADLEGELARREADVPENLLSEMARWFRIRCLSLTPDLRRSVCFEEGSARDLELRRVADMPWVDGDAKQAARYQRSAATTRDASAPPIPAAPFLRTRLPLPRPPANLPVVGFSIEPTR
jgi:hypothetical protein